MLATILSENGSSLVLLATMFVLLIFAFAALIYLPAHIKVKWTPAAGLAITFEKKPLKDNLFAALIREWIDLFRRR